MVAKYHNKKATYDGHTFDSVKEMNCYKKLKLLEKAGIIKELELQKDFELQPSFKINNRTNRKITYKADFTYKTTKDDRMHVIDVKGFRTDVYRLKKKLFEYRYRIEIEEI